MAITTPDNIYYPVSTDQVAPLASHFENLADTTQDALTRIKQTQRMYVKNGAVALTKGTPVYITGADGTNVIVGAATNATEAGSSKTIGLLETDLAINAMGYVVTNGICTNINTSGATAAGDPVWLGVNGAKIYGLANKPVAPAHMVYLGVVTRKNANTGEIEVRVQNGFELEELHNVLITNPQDKQVVAYEGGLWKNKQATGGVTVGATAPAGPNPGDAWYNSNNGMLYVWYVDADSTAQWVQVKANSGLEGSILARLGSLESTTVAFGNLSPNYIINGAFDIWQRGTSFVNPSNTTSFTADRYFHYRGGLVTGMTTSRQDAGLAGFRYCARIQRASGNTSVEGLNFLYNTIETSQAVALAGKTVTLSFYARAGANYSASSSALTATVSSGTGIDQNPFSWTGGVTVANGNSTLTATWQRFTYTGAVPSNSSELYASFAYTPTGTAGTNDYFEITGVQLEVGSTATAFRRNQPNIQAELAACQRYFQALLDSPANISAMVIAGTSYSTTGAVFGIPLPVQMRTSPSGSVSSVSHFAVDLVGAAAVTASTLAIDNTSANFVRVAITHSTNASFGSHKSVALVANSTSSARIYLSSEL